MVYKCTTIITVVIKRRRAYINVTQSSREKRRRRSPGASVTALLQRDAMLARYICCRRAYVRLSVRPSQADTVSKRLNVEQSRTIAYGL